MAKKIGTKKVKMYGEVVTVNVYGPPEESDFQQSTRKIGTGSFSYLHSEDRTTKKSGLGRKKGKKGKINIGRGRPRKKSSKASGPSESSERDKWEEIVGNL